MGVNEIRSVIERSAAELRAAGLGAIYLFGSQARGEAGEESDIDIAFDVAPEADEKFSLLDQAGLQIRLQELLGRKVDFLERRAIHRDLRPRIERDMVRLL
jgi:predicted nucleotidyltransferase